MDTHEKPELGPSELVADSSNLSEPDKKEVTGVKIRREESSGGKQRKQRKRRQKIRKWKPYSQMTWEEKQEFQEYENLRIERHLQQVQQLGKRKAVAPYNTTQFLMDDKPSEQPHMNTPSSLLAVNIFSLDSGNESNSSADGPIPIYEPSPDYLDHDFESAFTDAHASRLDAMSKEELVSHCMGVEKLVDVVQTKLSAFRQATSREVNSEIKISEQVSHWITELEEAVNGSSSNTI
ncbi:Protein HEXIM1 [Oopsacas minuta]|uniref:Protein HEXIM1 n=1 Tax=Oopsacas minuta TaxID=111878 RepID=A0AAV7K9Q7_9METZ|nr:Protein HEXIM1 [Oopsacas minuta]